MSKNVCARKVSKRRSGARRIQGHEGTHATTLLPPGAASTSSFVPAISRDGEAERGRLEAKYCDRIREEKELSRFVGFVGNRNVPLLRLFRFKEAFSLHLVREFFRRFHLTSDDYVFDPFCGMGTTMFASSLEGIPSVGVEKLPIAILVARTLNQMLRIKPADLSRAYEIVKQTMKSCLPATIAEDVPLIRLAFSEEQLLKLKRIKGAIDLLHHPCRDVLTMLFLSILEDASYTAKDGQFLRLLKDKPLPSPLDLLTAKVELALKDIELVQSLIPPWWRLEDGCRIHEGDTRQLNPAYFQKLPTAIVTSPPYANRYDYSRTYCLELCFHFVRNFEELKAIRFGILRSHIEVKVESDEQAVHPALAEVVEALAKKDLNNPRIPIMLIAYFADMAKAIAEWGKYLAPGAKVALVIDNVRYEGEMVPVDLILTELAESHGFTCDAILVARYKSNSSQQMSKYGRRPVRESILIWRKR